MALSDTKARTANPKSKQYKLIDGNELFLLVSPAGGKWWRFNYRFGGKEMKTPSKSLHRSGTPNLHPLGHRTMQQRCCDALY
jgi:hypothetical protein